MWKAAGRCVAIAGLCLAIESRGELIEKKVTDYSATDIPSTPLIEKHRSDGRITGNGYYEYDISIPVTGWYELYLAAAWDNDIHVDGERVVDTFLTDVWGKTEGRNVPKVVNLYLQEGTRRLRIIRAHHPGLHAGGAFYLKPAGDITGMVRLTPVKDYLVFRRGEAFPLTLRAGRQKGEERIVINLTDPQSEGKIVSTIEKVIPAGEGLHEEEVAIPTDKEGVFDISAVDKDGRMLDRVMQYLVVDTENRPNVAGELKKQLLYTIDAADKAPDYVSDDTRVVKTRLGAYRESGARGYRDSGAGAASWFAYTLELPAIQEPYLLEIEYPDDAARIVSVTLVEGHEANYAPQPSVGYWSGGVYPLVNETRTLEFFVFPREKDPRLLFLNWNDGQRAALGRIKVYKIEGGFPSLRPGAEGRMLGMLQEELIRYPTKYGGTVEPGWLGLWRPAEWAGMLMNYAGLNLWSEQFSAYQSVVWPSKVFPHRINNQSGPIGLPTAVKWPFQADVGRLMLLVSEKYGLNFIGETVLKPNGYAAKKLDARFGGQGAIEDDGPHKPWLSVSSKGVVGDMHHQEQRYNPLHPAVQDWVADVFREVAERYGDCAAFKGLSLRISGWQVPDTKTYLSIHRGYEDYTVERFEKETGLKIPVSADDPGRFQKRYEWLMANAYPRWVDWRCGKIYAYHSRLAKILADSGDRKLYLNLYDNRFDHTSPSRELRSWVETLKESGIDPALYAANPDIVLGSSRGFPDGGNRAGTHGGKNPLRAAEMRDRSLDLEPLKALAKPLGGGTTSALLFGTDHEGNYVTLDKLGYGDRGPTWVVYPDSSIEPAGNHSLERFANAMADGNVTLLIGTADHGYNLGQPAYLRRFALEYRALPDMGMSAFPGSVEPVALWHGEKDGAVYLYLVNRLSEDVAVSVSFAGGTPALKRLATGDSVNTEGGMLAVKLTGYELLGLESDRVPSALRAEFPAGFAETVETQAAFVAALLSGSETADLSVLELSPVELRKAVERLREAREAIGQGRLLSARRLLLHGDLIKVYVAFESYPPGLFHDQRPSIPPTAMTPAAMMDRAGAESRGQVRIADGETVSAALAGTDVLQWDGEEIALSVDVPFSGMYRFKYVYPATPPYSEPAVHVNGKPIGTETPASEMSGWGKKATIPISMREGVADIRIRKQPAAALCFFGMEPLHRDIAPEKFMAVGPFEGVGRVAVKPNEQRFARMDEALLPEQEMVPGKEINLAGVYEGDKGQKVTWKRPETSIPVNNPYGNYVDLYETFGVLQFSISYAVTRIACPETRKAEVSFGSDYWAKIWLNGEVVKRPESRPSGSPRKVEERFPVTLREGDNILLIKNHAGNAGNGFFFAITDPGDLRTGI